MCVPIFDVAAICPLLCSPWHGNINTTLGNLAGSKVTYTCDHDYHLVGPEERICLADGTWDYADPHCEPVGKSTIYLWQCLRPLLPVTMIII